MKKTLLFIICNIIVIASFAQNSGCATMLMNQDTSIFPGAWVQLEAHGMFQYYWTPNFYSPEDSTQWVSPSNTQTYYVTGYYQDSNIVQNGDFELGNTQFVSSYIFNNSSVWNEGTYAVGQNCHTYHSNFGNYYDHTTGSGIYMIVNGATVTNQVVWTQTVPVVPHTNYVFTTWTQTFSAPQADLQFSINGVQIGSVFQSPATLGVWQQFYQIWDSGNSTQAVITILNQNTTAGGNDFGLDDIAFCPLYPCTDSVTIEVLMPISAVNDTIVVCSGDTAIINPLLNDTIDSRCGDVMPELVYPTWYAHVEIDSTDIAIMPGQLYNGMDSIQYQICCGGQCDTATIYVIISGTHQIFSDTICAGQAYDGHGFTIPETETFNVGLNHYQHDTITPFGCDSIVELYLQINAQPNIEVEYFGCDTFQWNDEIILETGDYIQSFITEYGCDSIVTAHITIKHDTIILHNSLEDFCLNDLTYFVIECDLDTILWSTGETVPVIAISEPGTYWISAQEHDCVASDTIVIEVCCPDDSYQIPNVITPSQQDGVNDVFKLPEGFEPMNLEINIYNRWGKKVFHSEDPAFEWGGTEDGHIRSGVYYYELLMNHQCDYHGSITVF